MGKETLRGWLCGVASGAFMVAFLFYPPHASWNDKLELGDVATWFSSFATMAAVFVALHIANGEGRRAALEAERLTNEKAAEELLSDYRTAVLVQPALASARAACEGVIKTLRSGVSEFGLHERDLVLEMGAFKQLAGLASECSGTSVHLAKNLLRAISYSQQMVLAIETGTELEVLYLYGARNGEHYVLTGPAARNHLMTTAMFVASYVRDARTDVEAAIARLTPPVDDRPPPSDEELAEALGNE